MHWLALISAFALSVITVVGDVLIKTAADKSQWQGIGFLVCGAVIYAMTAFGWFYVMRSEELTDVGVLYGVSTVVLLFLVSAFYFKEHIAFMEIVGLVMAVTALFLMLRFQ